MKLTLRELTTHTRLLGATFKPSYTPMLSVLLAAFCEGLTPPEREHFDKLCGGRALPAARMKELWIVAGRGSGKTQAAALIVIALALCCTWPTTPGQIPVALLLAADRESSRVAFKFIVGLLRSSPVLWKKVVNVTRDRITLSNDLEIVVATSDYRMVRGRSLIAVIADELAFWPVSATSASPDREVLNAVRPGLARFPGAMLVCISSPYAQAGELYEADRRYFGKDDARVLVARGGTLDFNPEFSREEIEAALERDSQSASAEYLGIYRSDVVNFLDGATVDSATRPEPLELLRQTVSRDGGHVVYVAGVDPSGGRSDAAAAAVAHSDRDRIVIDAVRRWPSPHDPAVVAKEVAAFLAHYGLRTATADAYGAEITRSVYREAGVELLTSDASRSELYMAMLPLFTTGRIEIPPDSRLRLELLTLERRTARGGKDSVDHRVGAQDDVCNAAALAARAVSRRRDAGRNMVAAGYSTLFDGMGGPVARPYIHPCDRRPDDSIGTRIDADLNF